MSARRTEKRFREQARHQVVNWRRSSAYASRVSPRYPARNPASASHSASLNTDRMGTRVVVVVAVIGYLPVRAEAGRLGQARPQRNTRPPPSRRRARHVMSRCQPSAAPGSVRSLPILCAPEVGGPVGPKVAERPDMRDHLIAPVIPDWRGARRSCPDMWLLAGEDVSHLVPCVLVCWPLVMVARRAARAGRRHDRLVPGGLILVRPHPGRRPCDASRSTARITPAAGNGQPDRPVHHLARRPRMRRTARPRGRLGHSLVRHWPAARAHARPEVRRSSPERIAPASAGSRCARTGTARQPGPPGTPRRSRVRTDHTSPSFPRHLPVRCRARGAWPAAP